MKKLLELFTKFHVALFIFGFILVLLSVTTGLELPIIQNIIADDNSRILAFGGGLGIILASIIVYLFDKSRIKTPEVPVVVVTGTGDGKPEPEEPKLPSRSGLTGTQREILNFIEAQHIQFGVVGQNALEEKYCKIGKSELYYRLEALMYQGFLKKSSAGLEEGKQKHLYRLSKEYCKAHNVGFSGSGETTTLIPPPSPSDKHR